MQIANLDQLGGPYEHVYLAPHLDDAVLSCGGAIIAQQMQGARVLVVTLCTAAPAPDAPLSALAQEFHAQWRLSAAQAVAARLAEERAAMALLGVDYLWAGLLDAIYRYPQAYHSRESLFSTPAPDDPQFEALRALLGTLRERLPNALFYAPLGVGSHVDHLITHQAAREVAGAQLAFYEDLPYATVPGAFERRMSAVAPALRPRTADITTTLPAKLDTIAAYASQMHELFGGEAAMRAAISAYAASVRLADSQYGERVWAAE